MAGICIGIALAVVIILFLVWFFSYYNKIIKMENRIDNAWAQIDVQLKRRADLIPNLLGIFPTHVVDRHVASVFGELEGDGFSDSLTCTRYKGFLTI